MTKIPITPRLRAQFWNTANSLRSESEIRRWWCRPFVMRRGDMWSVHCLDGGAWDRPTLHFMAATETEAVAYAEELHRIYWGQPSSNELPLPNPYEMMFHPVSGPGSMLMATPVGPAVEARKLRERHMGRVSAQQ